MNTGKINKARGGARNFKVVRLTFELVSVYVQIWGEEQKKLLGVWQG